MVIACPCLYAVAFGLQTGPKGVIQDWRRYKQLETEKREEHEKERIELAKKLSVQCRSHVSPVPWRHSHLCMFISICMDGLVS